MGGCSITAHISETSSAPAHTLWGTVTDDGYPNTMTWNDSTGQSGSAKVANEHATYIIQFSNNGEWVKRHDRGEDTWKIVAAVSDCPGDLAGSWDETPSGA